MGKKALALFLVLFSLFGFSGIILAEKVMPSGGIVSDQSSIVSTHQPVNKIIMYRDKIPIKVDYDKGVLVVQGKEIPIIVDGDVKITAPSTKGWVYLPYYDRFDVYIDENYYANNTAELNLFFDRFEPRYELMETLTGWSSEKFYSQKLKIYVNSSINYGNSCSTGYAVPGEAHVFMYKNLSRQDVCKFPYYIDGTPYFENPGELGDYWWYMTGALHESLHSINPLPIYTRRWLTEGWSEYYMYNILSSYYGNSYPDINQETADYYIYQGTPSFNWLDYVTNNYRDYANNEIQQSQGYDITAWMFSMLRDGNYSGGVALPWEEFYSIIDNNPETLDKSYELGKYYTDTHVIDVFERATGVAMYPVFRYDNSSGPGWGVRNWTNLNWYADLEPVLVLSKTDPIPGETVTINTTIHNYGDVSLNGVSVRFYTTAMKDSVLLDEQFVDVPAQGSVIVSTEFSSSGEGAFEISVVVDEDSIKIEKNELNNEDSQTVNYAYVCGDTNADAQIQIGDVIYILNYLFKHGNPPLCSPMTECGDANIDGKVDLGDAIYLLNYLFKNGSAPCHPGKFTGLSGPLPQSYDEAMELVNDASNPKLVSGLKIRV